MIHTTGWVTVLAIVFLGVVSPAMAAHAADPRVEISHDGVTFSHGSDLGLFTDMGYLSPSDAESETVWVRNATSETGRLRIDVHDAWSSDPALAAAMVLTTRTPNAQPSTVIIGDVINAPGGCQVINGPLLLGPGETVELTARLALESSLGDQPGQSGQAGALSEARFAIRAVLVDSSVPSEAMDDCSDTSPSEWDPAPTPDAPLQTINPDGSLPMTGTDVALGGAVAAGLAIAAGATLMLARRRSRTRLD